VNNMPTFFEIHSDRWQWSLQKKVLQNCAFFLPKCSIWTYCC